MGASRRSVRGGGARARGGGGGSGAGDVEGGVMGAAAVTMVAGDERRDWRLRQVVKRFPMAFWGDICGGLAGGEAKRADSRRVSGGCDESQVKAEGRSMFFSFLFFSFFLRSSYFQCARQAAGCCCFLWCL